MRNKAILAAFVSLLYLNIVSGQTPSDIEMKYGKPVNVYSASEHIWMTPEYAADGQICRMSFYSKRISADTNYLSNELPVWELLTVFNQLSPHKTRGARKEFFGTTHTSASMAWTSFEYEKVTITFWTSFKFGSVADMEEKGVPLGGRTPAITTQSDDEFMSENAVNPVMVYLKWKDRKCARQ